MTRIASTEVVPGLYMVTATYEGAALAIRFCKQDEVDKLFDPMIKQIRSRFDSFKGMKPKQIKQAVTWNVWAVPSEPKHGGWPIWLGPTAYYT